MDFLFAISLLFSVILYVAKILLFCEICKREGAGDSIALLRNNIKTETACVKEAVSGMRGMCQAVCAKPSADEVPASPEGAD